MWGYPYFKKPPNVCLVLDGLDGRRWSSVPQVAAGHAFPAQQQPEFPQFPQPAHQQLLSTTRWRWCYARCMIWLPRIVTFKWHQQIAIFNDVHREDDEDDDKAVGFWGVTYFQFIKCRKIRHQMRVANPCFFGCRNPDHRSYRSSIVVVWKQSPSQFPEAISPSLSKSAFLLVIVVLQWADFVGRNPRSA